ncbi:hypothetical protein [Fortiea sp. LEGE XX443]|uniref:hypothetical protein n=1 Tax=Fortiea sp. LEGE XX443 TaxID=1828611 RepID=UPI001D14B9A7|nr:hypothetical protein [Fortiea sp. LEGE XX443]
MAKLLAQDLEQFAPGYPFIIYSDRPHLFKNNLNVLAVKHSCRGVLPYHERRFAIWQALSISSSVMYLDADVRICASVPETLDFLPGLTARSCGNLQKHIQEQFTRNPNSPKLQHKKYVLERMANQIGIDIDSPELKFINEFLFVVNAHEGRELEFLKIWGELAIYADTLGMHKHPTYAMALAAVKSKFPIHQSEMNGLDFFDDRIEKVRLSKGQSTPGAKAQYFHQQNIIEKVDHNLFQSISRLVNNKSSLLYNRTRVQLVSKMFPSVLVDYPELKSNH